MNMSTITTTCTIRKPIEQVDKSIIDALLTHIDAVPEGHYWAMEEGDPLYIAPTGTMMVLASTVRDPETTEIGDECQFADFYDMNGHRLTVEERPERWLEQQMEIRHPGRNWATENAAHRLGDHYIVIGRGRWFVSADVTVDGERAFEVITGDALLKRKREKRIQERHEYIAAHPIIEASMPSWANDVDVDTTFYDIENEQNDTDAVLVMYGFETPAGRIYEDFRFHDGLLEATQTSPMMSFEDHVFPVSSTAALARGMRDLVEVLDTLTAKEPV